MTAYPYQLLLKHLLHQGVSWAPDQQIIYRDQVRFTYREFYQRVLRLGGALGGLGLKQGARVGVIEWDSHRYLEMYFGIPGIGAVMHTVNPRLAPEDVIFTINQAEDETLIFHEDFLPLVERIRPALTTVSRYILISDKPSKPELAWAEMSYEELLGSAAPLTELPDLDENTLATLSYTTGTTGRPRGVSFTQRQLTLQTLCDAVGLSALGSYGGVNKHDVYMPLTPMYHGHAWGMPYVATMLGLKMVFPGKYEPPMMIKLLLEEKVTFSHCIPTILQMVIYDPAAKGVHFGNWRIIVGGAVMPKSLAVEAAKMGAKVYGGYGLSETCPVLTISNLKPFMEEWDESKQLDWLIKPGFTIPLVYLKVVDDSGEEVAKDGRSTGEVLARSPWCTAAYLNESALTEELWEGEWLHTGDVATVDEYGYIQIVDRIKDIIKSGGEWIVSLELERLIGQFAGIKDIVVIGVPDARWGERPLVLYVTKPEQEEAVTPDALKTHLKQYVTSGVITAVAVPDYYVRLDEIPKTSVGKFDRKLLRQRYKNYANEG